MGKDVPIFLFGCTQGSDVPVHGQPGNKSASVHDGYGRQVDLKGGAIGRVSDGFPVQGHTPDNGVVHLFPFFPLVLCKDQGVEIFALDGGGRKPELGVKGLIGLKYATLCILKHQGTGRGMEQGHERISCQVG